MLRLFPILTVLLLAGCAKGTFQDTVLDDVFLADGPQAFPLDIETTDESPERASAATAREAEVPSPGLHAPDYASLEMQRGRAVEGGRDILSVSRDADNGQILSANYSLDGSIPRPAGARTFWTTLYHSFDADGRTIEVRLSGDHEAEPACGGVVTSIERRLTIGADGRLLRARRSVDTSGDPTEVTASPEACQQPDIVAPIQVYPTLEALLSGLGAPPADSLVWTRMPRPTAPPAMIPDAPCCQPPPPGR